MEELLRYSLFELTLFILIIELKILSGLLLLIFFIKWIKDTRKRRKEQNKAALSELIMSAFNEKKWRPIPKKYHNFNTILEVLENFDHRITDNEWKNIRDQTIDHYLIKEAKTMVKSRSWVKRQRAARCFLLNPSKSLDEDLKILLNDSKFLVRVVAAACIIQKSNQDLFEETLRKMAEETPLSRYAYRDALMNANSEKFAWMEALAKKETNEEICAICLDLLSTRSTHDLFPLATFFIYNKNIQCKVQAINILKTLPGDQSKDILMHCLSDPNWEIRSHGVKALAFQHAVEKAPDLEHLLSDPVWFVRLQAALALKQFGNEGFKLLSSQNAQRNPKSYEIAQYVLNLP